MDNVAMYTAQLKYEEQSRTDTMLVYYDLANIEKRAFEAGFQAGYEYATANLSNDQQSTTEVQHVEETGTDTPRLSAPDQR